ncbi:MAG TPA: hypothetical protein DEG17_04115 [Cyanobacteria bacterium UBA11149]|nr:hypothetical protein [Cyanobacteria bacterium UBA11367]HBE59557.1 hypothetical protein [Cyanobacteria bacterium UBA11366]HBR75053.1 hypothetical protein [Cyanobacteria bacterium UBA11159]HBS68051.1 hypothetical protein [Cyanobacteria bacterium UBA11153]HBW88076.1 hypothetical protein [Cyanobacteria bacterium UBA11149]HCA95271.1 hypothetical protein [Cyanobacteria bacterium UBA9226]
MANALLFQIIIGQVIPKLVIPTPHINTLNLLHNPTNPSSAGNGVIPIFSIPATVDPPNPPYIPRLFHFPLKNWGAESFFRYRAGENEVFCHN